ncbi:MAG: hypothetical protein ACRDP6_49340 [Actinoallomurus sp.]
MGPGAGGLLLQLITAPFAVVADAVGYVLSAGMLARVRTVEAPASRRRAGRPWAEVREGVRALLRDRLLGPVGGLGALPAAFLTACLSRRLPVGKKIVPALMVSSSRSQTIA